ncbi:MAG: C-GCAxxG-C-C family (seleno)protein [Dysosmobacter welbionis]
MDRCAAAYAYHKQGYNCAQSVAGAFADLTGTAPEQLMAAMGGFGGGVGGSHEELCGAVSGGVLVLSLLHPIRTERTGPERCASTPRPRSSAAGSRRCSA